MFASSLLDMVVEFGVLPWMINEEIYVWLDLFLLFVTTY